MFTDLTHRLRSLIRRRTVEQDLDDELRFHFERLIDRHVANGLAHDEALRRARLEMGGFDQVKEEHRDARGVRLLEDLGDDLRYAIRQVKRSPGFAVLAVLCLGLGIGANTSIFSALNSVLFRPLPGADPGRLLMLSRGTSAYFSYPDFQDLQAHGRLLSGLTASFPMESDLEVDGVSEFVAAEVVSANYGSVVGVVPALGRWFTSETEPIAVISYAVWQNRFGGSADVLGRRIGSEAQSYTIVVGVVLLIACVNVGNLLLVRGSLRRRELAIRQALGATKSRLIRQLLTESLVLAIGGGASGLVLAGWTTRILERVMPSVRSTFPIELDLSLDGRVIAFATILSLATTLVCGLVPAWRGSQSSGVAAFKGEIGGSIRRRRPFGLVTQVVLSFVLLLIAGSVIETLRRLQVTDPGFAISGRLYAYIYFPSASTPETGRELYAQALDRLRALPGVLSASQTSALPLMPSGTDCVSLSGGPQLHVSTYAIDLAYFHTMGIGMIGGRDFTSIDLPRESSTIVITASLAKRLWPNTSPIGERVLIGCQAPQASVVIGVVRDSAVRDVGEPPQPRFYRPFARQYDGGLTAVLLETGTDPAAMVPEVRQSRLGMAQNI